MSRRSRPVTAFFITQRLSGQTVFFIWRQATFARLPSAAGVSHSVALKAFTLQRDRVNM